MQEATAALEELKLWRTEWESERVKLEQEMETQSQTIQSKEENIKDLHGRLEETIKCATALQEQSIDASKEHSAAQKQAEAQRLDLESTLNKTQLELKHAQATLEELTGTLKAEKEATEAAVSSSKSSEMEHSALNDKLKLQIKEQEKECKNLRAEMAKNAKQAKDSEKKLQKQLEKLNTTLDEAQQGATKKQETQAQEMAKILQESVDLKATNDSTISKLGDLERIKKELESALESKVAELGNSEKTAQANLARCQEEFNRMKRVEDELREERDDLLKKDKTQQKDSSSVQKQMEVSQEALAAARDELKTATEQAEKEKQKMLEILKEKTEMLEEKTEMLEKTSERLRRTQKDLESVRTSTQERSVTVDRSVPKIAAAKPAKAKDAASTRVHATMGVDEVVPRRAEKSVAAKKPPRPPAIVEKTIGRKVDKTEAKLLQETSSGESSERSTSSFQFSGSKSGKTSAAKVQSKALGVGSWQSKISKKRSHTKKKQKVREHGGESDHGNESDIFSFRGF
mmetsp:Transcript_57356/g.124672  ORF Transcript_57356/g.124672 Transcript_57356/m.124672 type:complete len:517 (-) Transcript_57356:31-1581(-)